MSVRKYNIDYSEITLLNLILFAWQLPQNVVAALIYMFIQRFPYEWKNEENGMTLLCVSIAAPFCFSLGQFIFLGNQATEAVKKHESGHSVQSVFLGPLYLLCVGIPSLILFLIAQFRKRVLKHSEESVSRWYHSCYPEKWADKLGGVC